jgi:hypothetical protein
MKKICILSYERTGSTWLMGLFNSVDSISLDEPFSDDPTLVYFNLMKLFHSKDIIDKNIIEVFSKIYHPNNFFINPQNFIQVKQKMLNSNPFTFEYLDGLINEMDKAGKKHIAFKIFPSHIKNNISVKKVLELSDIVILNYRNNLLDTYISHCLAQESGTWFKSHNFRQSNYDDIKLLWDTNKYNNYVNFVINNKFNFFKKYFDEVNKPKILLSYEQIHEENQIDKIQNLKHLFANENIDIPLNNIENFFKQNNRKYNDIFMNQNDFITDLPHIRKFIYA